MIGNGINIIDSKIIKDHIQKTIRKANKEKIRDLFKNDCFNLLNIEDFNDLWEDPKIRLLENLLIVNREQESGEFSGYYFPECFKIITQFN